MTRAALLDDELQVSIGNCGSKRVPRVGVLMKQRSDVIVLSEAYRARAWLRTRAALRGYAYRQSSARRGPEAPGVAMMIRHQDRITRRMLLILARRWRGPFTGRQRAPRRFPVFQIRKGHQVWMVGGVHFPPTSNGTGGGRIAGPNAAAIRESVRELKAFRRENPHMPVVFAGDFNLVIELMRRHFRRWALARGRKVDHALGYNARPVMIRRHRAPRGCHGFVTFRYAATR